MSLLTIDGNPKVMKGNARGYLTAILHLAPATLAGVGNMCPHATPGCIAACLNTAGRGGMFKEGGTNSIQEARKRKTLEFKHDEHGFMTQLHREISALVRKAGKRNLTPCVRLNGTSDIRWEHIKLDGRSLMEWFPAVQFYDYTKFPSRKHGLANYHLTFSLAENNDAKACVALNNGTSVAVAMFIKRGEPMPATFTIGGVPWPVIDGDETDLRFLDPKGCIVGLRAKGRAKRDTSGFVRHVIASA
jgi:hypothetical protein